MDGGRARPCQRLLLRFAIVLQTKKLGAIIISRETLRLPLLFSACKSTSIHALSRNFEHFGTETRGSQDPGRPQRWVHRGQMHILGPSNLAPWVWTLADASPMATKVRQDNEIDGVGPDWSSSLSEALLSALASPNSSYNFTHICCVVSSALAATSGCWWL